MVGSSGKASSSSPPPRLPAPRGATSTAGVDLWDSGWPSGRFYWTVVPVSVQLTKITPPASSSGTGTATLVRHRYAVLGHRRWLHVGHGHPVFRNRQFVVRKLLELWGRPARSPTTTWKCRRTRAREASA